MPHPSLILNGSMIDLTTLQNRLVRWETSPNHKHFFQIISHPMWNYQQKQKSKFHLWKNQIRVRSFIQIIRKSYLHSVKTTRIIYFFIKRSATNCIHFIQDVIKWISTRAINVYNKNKYSLTEWSPLQYFYFKIIVTFFLQMQNNCHFRIPMKH